MKSAGSEARVQQHHRLVFVLIATALVLSACGLSSHGHATLSWSKGAQIVPDSGDSGTSGNGFPSVACASSEFCAAGYSQSVVTYNGSRWGQPVTIATSSADEGFGSIACPTSKFCALVNQDGYAITYDGKSWQPAINVRHYPASSTSTTAFEQSISCPTDQFCLSVDVVGSLAVYREGKWTASAPTGLYNQGRFNSFESLSCASSRFCAAVDDSGDAFIYNGIVWGPPTHLDRFSSPLGGVMMVSCPTVSFCAVAGGNGNAYIYNGDTWSKPTKFYAATKQNGPTWLSCAASTLCVAIDNVGNAITYNGTEWSRPTLIDQGGLLSVSCPTTRFCLATDGEKFFVYR